MSVASFRKVCLDAVDPARVGPFWSAVLDRPWQPDDRGEGGLFGPTRGHTVWVNRVPEPKSVKHRVHLDIYARSLDDLTGIGAEVLRPAGDDRTWTLMADPESGEFCAFLREQPPQDRLHGLVVDSADPAAQAQWWADVYGAEVVHETGWSTVQKVPGMPILTMDFVPVPEPKTGKNRVHWDVGVDAVEDLVARGATVLRPMGEDLGWHVVADPEGNEFCAFVDPGR